MQAAEAKELQETFALIAGVRHIAVALSGGSDSMALLLLAWEHAHGQRVALTVLTFDHGLRPESAAEAQWVKEWCEGQGISHRILKWEGKKPTTGIQAAARKARYDALTAEAARFGADVLLTGHTANDQAETYVMRKARTQSPSSLASIWPEMTWNGVRVVRPLLGFKREALREMLRERNIPWIDDPSNANERFERVRVRKSLDEGIVDQVAAQAQVAQRAALEAVRIAKAWCKEIEKDKYGVVRFSRAGLLGLPAPAQHEAIKAAFRFFAVDAGKNVTAGERERLLSWIAGHEEGRRTLGDVVFSLSKGTVSKGKVALMRELARLPTAEVPETSEILWDGRFLIRAPAGARVTPLGRTRFYKRDPAIPALVQRGLPCVILGDAALTTVFECAQALDSAGEAPMLSSTK